MSSFSMRESVSGRRCVRRTHDGRLAPRKVRRPEQINEPLGRRRADQLAHLLGMDEGMILTDAEYHCVIGTPPRPPDRETIFRCIYNLTNSNGNAAIPLSSYGLNVTEQGNVRSICAPGSPCLEFNALFGGRLEEIFAECGCPGQVSAGGGRNAVTSAHRRCESLPNEWRTRVPHRNDLRGKLTLGKRLRRPETNRLHALFAGC